MPATLATSPPADAITAASAREPVRVAVIGAGIAGTACAASLQLNGLQVTLFDKSRGLGGRMATRRLHWPADAATGVRAGATEIDHGAQHFQARSPRFRAVVQRAVAAGAVLPWQPLVHARGPGLEAKPLKLYVPTPDMPALCRHLLVGVPVRLEHTVQRLHREADGWYLVLVGGGMAGPFDQVHLALPPAQAAVLLAGHQDPWADELAAWRMQACWTLMAVTDDVDWPWDAAEPERGPLAWVARNDRKPGRCAPAGCATWVAHATGAWSAAHLEEDPEAVAVGLRAALAALLPAGGRLRWHTGVVHRWRYAVPAAPAAVVATAAPGASDVPALQASECRWDPGLGLGVCGDYLAGGDVEAAWRSGDELADTVVAWLETAPTLVEAS